MGGHCLAKKGKFDRKRCKKPTALTVQSPTFDPTQEPTFDPTQEPTFDPTQEPTPPPTFYPIISPVIQAGGGYYEGEVVGVVNQSDCSITAKWEVTNNSKNSLYFWIYLDECDNFSYATYSTQEISKGENKFSNVYSGGCYRFYLADIDDNIFAVSEKINYPGCS